MVSSRGLKSGVLVPISISLIRLWYRRTEFLKTFSFNSSSLKMVLSMGKKMWMWSWRKTDDLSVDRPVSFTAAVYA